MIVRRVEEVPCDDDAMSAFGALSGSCNELIEDFVTVWINFVAAVKTRRDVDLDFFLLRFAASGASCF